MAETQGERPSIKERATGVAQRVGRRLQEWGKDRFGADEVVAANLNYYEKVHNALSGKPQEVFEKLRKPWELGSNLAGLSSTVIDASFAPIWGSVGFGAGYLGGAIKGVLGFGLPVMFLGRLAGFDRTRVNRVANYGAQAIALSQGIRSGVKNADKSLAEYRPFRRLARKQAEIMGKVVPKAIETAGNLQDRVSGVIDRLRNTWRKPPEQSSTEQVFVGRGKPS